MQETSSDNPLNGYSFSYISKNEFESIFKHIRRERKKKQDEKQWEHFLLKKQEKHVNPSVEVMTSEVPDNSKAPPHPDNANLDAYKYCPKSNVPAVACSHVQKTEPFAMRLGHHRCPDTCFSPEPHIMSPSHQVLSSERPDCGYHCLGFVSNQFDNPNELLPHPKKIISESFKHVPMGLFQVPHTEDNKLFEITNFDQEFKRVEELRDKIIFTLKSIEDALCQENYKCLDKEELLRNKMRTAEFAARFKRNYHYQITRQVNEIKKLSSNESWKKSNFPSSVKKFKSSHQVAAQALQAVEKHLRTTNDGSSHLWLQDFLSSVCEMEKLFSDVFHCDDEEEQIAIKSACSNIIQAQLESMANRHKREPEVRKKKKKLVVKRNEAKDNLWMYRTHKDWKTKAAELARAKLSKINKKKTEQGEVDDRLDEKSIPSPDNLQDLKMEVKQREGASLRKHMRSIKEDQVRTMMEIVPDATDSDHEEERADVEQRKERIAFPDRQTQVGQKRDDAPPIKDEQPKKLGPSNVGYFCLKSEERPTKSSGTYSDAAGESLQLKYKSHQVNLATKYRKALQSYQRKQKWYNPNVIYSIDQMTDQIYEELIGSVASEINIDHIISNLIELEVRR